MVDQLVGIWLRFRMMDLLRCLVKIGLVCPVCGGAQWHGRFCDLGRHLTWPPECSAVQPETPAATTEGCACARACAVVANARVAVFWLGKQQIS